MVTFQGNYILLSNFVNKRKTKRDMDKESFIKEEVPAKLNELSEKAAPQWGILTPQAMVEHLVSSWRLANGKAEAKCEMPQEKLKAYRDFLFSDQSFEKNIKNPALPENETPKLRKSSLKEATEQLVGEIEDFFEFFKQNPSAQPEHPVFGALDKEGWLIFQYKHITHHFRQFNLID